MNNIKIDKKLSYYLRHKPENLGIKLGSLGEIKIIDLITAWNKKYTEELTLEKLKEVMAESDKERFLLDEKEGTIRAMYGHSIKLKKSDDVKPPKKLYHGTSHKNYEQIKLTGIKSMQRDYVHSSGTIKQAIEVGKRRDNTPVILEINSEQAYKDGIKFYKEKNDVWLSEDLPIKYLKEQKE